MHFDVLNKLKIWIVKELFYLWTNSELRGKEQQHIYNLQAKLPTGSSHEEQFLLLFSYSKNIIIGFYISKWIPQITKSDI